ncbi:DUF3885 domain-containing protein [Halarcobacter ebronensis]|uniref:DUF3885 domain-containing protein n=1 Tax=Halarcobacter ebronensis TaxID=1462615 RepID=A0A4Q1AWZ7_9BACT|nr:hypothetical protein [Halarcobacter ebronensis]QKF82606.1 hypothetical protein AEBR_2129 [Halarcobacter ebronensis]RXK07386.1 hypothetical protein CRV07_02665 [Halarcobacter ebronensis]
MLKVKYTELFLSCIELYPTYLYLGKRFQFEEIYLEKSLKHIFNLEDSLIYSLHTSMLHEIRIVLQDLIPKQMKMEKQIICKYDIDMKKLYKRFIKAYINKKDAIYKKEIKKKKLIFIDDFSSEFVKKWQTKKLKSIWLDENKVFDKDYNLIYKLRANTEQTKNYKNWWYENYKRTAPVVYQIKDIYPRRHLRIHSLPLSKQYAETDDEKKEILYRHNQIASEVLGDNAECIVFIPKKYLQYDDFKINSMIWKSNSFNNYLLEIADDKIEFPLIVSLKTQNIYAPYDGGMDLFIINLTEKEKFIQKYWDWLPREIT